MQKSFLRWPWLAAVCIGLCGAAQSGSAAGADDGKVRIICFGAHPDDNEFKALEN